METDPEVVAKRAKALEDENWRFRSFLEVAPQLTPARVDAWGERRTIASIAGLAPPAVATTRSR